MKESSPSDSPRSPVPFEELLSAFHDGELSPQEREAVERQLADSPKARRQLQELQQMSSLLHGLPQPQLPPEFSRHVLRQAEQEMLIPRLRGAAPVARRKWPRYLVSLVASAAALLIAVFLMQRSNRHHTVEIEITDTFTAPSQKAATAHTGMAAPEAPPAMKESPVAVAMKGVDDTPAASVVRDTSARLKSTATSAVSADVSSSALVTSHEPRPESSAVRARPLPTIASKSVAARTLSAPATPGSLQMPAKDLSDFEVGQIFNVTRVLGNQALLVRVVVVDLREGREAVLQVVEGQDGAIDEQQQVVAKQMQPSMNAKPSTTGTSANGSQGILYETTTDQFANLIKRLLNQETAIAELQVDQPVNIDTLMPPAPPPSMAAVRSHASEETFSAAGAENHQASRGEKSSGKVAVEKPGLALAQKKKPDHKTADHNGAPNSESGDLSADAIVSGKAAESTAEKATAGGGFGGRVALRGMAGSAARSSINQPPSMEGPSQKGELAFPRNRTRIVQVQPELLNRKSGIGLVRRQLAKRALNAPIKDRLLPDGNPDEKKPAAANKPELDDNAKVAKAPATAPAQLPLHVLFVLEQQSPAIPIDGPAKARHP